MTNFLSVSFIIKYLRSIHVIPYLCIGVDSVEYIGSQYVNLKMVRTELVCE